MLVVKFCAPSVDVCSATDGTSHYIIRFQSQDGSTEALALIVHIFWREKRRLQG